MQYIPYPMTETPPGLRERKKQRTREAILKAALGLFDRQGFNETTIAQIAARADVSPRTVSGYFPAKEDLVFPEQEQAIAALAERLASRPGGELAPHAFRGWIEELMENWRGREETLRAQHRVISTTPALQARRQLFVARIHELLSEATASDLGAAPDELEPQIASAATTATVELLDRFVEAEPATSEDDLDARIAEVRSMLDRTVVFVAAGINALREERAV
jgi:AcrR family transcriptional regulator